MIAAEAAPPATPRRGGTRHRESRPEDDAALRRLLRERPMEGAIRVALTREPSFAAAAAVEGERHHTFVAEDLERQRLLGFGCRSVRRVYHHGRPALVGYLSQLRAAPGASGLRRLRAGYRWLRATRRDDEAHFDLTTILADNRPARRLLERGLPGLPVYRPLAEIETLILSVRPTPREALRRRSGRPAPRRLSAQDLPAIVSHLQRELSTRPFAPVWEAKQLGPGGSARGLEASDLWGIEERGELVACGGIWDQRAFKQARVAGYAGWLGALRRPLNPFLRLVGQPMLPPPGTTLAMASIACFAVRGAEPERAIALLEALRLEARRRGLEQLAISLAEGDRLLAPIHRRFAARRYRSLLYAVCWPELPVEADLLGEVPPYLEAGLL